MINVGDKVRATYEADGCSVVFEGAVVESDIVGNLVIDSFAGALPLDAKYGGLVPQIEIVERGFPSEDGAMIRITDAGSSVLKEGTILTRSSSGGFVRWSTHAQSIAESFLRKHVAGWEQVWLTTVKPV